MQFLLLLVDHLMQPLFHTHTIPASNGYRLVWCPSHPRCDSRGYVGEHIIVAEVMHGGPLPTGAVVHHINRIRDDNHPENLMIFPSQADHMRWHAEEDAWEACGHRHWRVCRFCHEYDDPACMRQESGGRNRAPRYYHPECRRAEYQWKKLDPHQLWLGEALTWNWGKR